MIDVAKNELPENWEHTTLGEITIPIEKIKPADNPDHEILYLDIGGIDKTTNTVTDHKKYLGKEAPSRAQQAIRSGDVAFANVRPYLKNIAIVPNVLDGQVGSTGFCFLRPKENISNKYIYYWVLSNSFIKDISKYQKGSSYPAVTNKQILERSIPLAPPEQQKRIVAKIEKLFSHIDAGIASLQAAKKLLKQYRQSVLKAAVTGELTKDWREANKDKLEPASKLLERILIERRQCWEEQQLEQFKAKGKLPKDDKWKEKYKEPELGVDRYFSEIPYGWTLGSLDQLAFDVRYGSSSKTNQIESGVPVLRMGNIIDGRLDYSNLKYLPVDHDEFPELLLEDGDLLFNRTNSAELVGKTAVFRETSKATSLASYLIRLRVMAEIEPDFVAYFINSSCGKDWIKNCVSQNVGQANVNGTKLKALIMPLPSHEEQTEIVRSVEEKLLSSHRLTTELDLYILKAEKNKQSALATAFSGSLN